MIGVFVEFERAMIQERIHAGLARARKQGKRLGQPRVSPKVEQAILVLDCAGWHTTKKLEVPENVTLMPLLINHFP